MASSRPSGGPSAWSGMERHGATPGGIARQRAVAVDCGGTIGALDAMLQPVHSPRARALLKALADSPRLEVIEALGEVSAVCASSPPIWVWPSRSCPSPGARRPAAVDRRPGPPLQRPGPALLLSWRPPPARPCCADPTIRPGPPGVQRWLRTSRTTGRRSGRRSARCPPVSGTRTGRWRCPDAPPGGPARSCSSPAPAGCRCPVP